MPLANTTKKIKPYQKRSANIVGAVFVALFVVVAIHFIFSSHAAPPTPNGENYQICDEQSQYLTSPYTYNGVAPGNTTNELPSSPGTETYTVAQYEALPGYGTTLPSLPSYISSQSSSTEAAVIYAPGAAANQPSYDFPNTPLLYFFEGGSYGAINFATVTGDEFIGGSATSYSEPTFNDAAAADGINAQNASFAYSGGTSTLASQANSGTNVIHIASTIPGYINGGSVTFADGTTYSIVSGYNSTTLTLGSNLTNTETSGTTIYADRIQPNAKLTASANQGATTVQVSSTNIPLMQWEDIVIGANTYQISSVSGSESGGYTLTLSGGLDLNYASNTPIYYNDLSGNVTVDYLNIADDQHVSTGTLYTGSGWTIENNDIHDGYSNGIGYGVAIDGGDNSTIEYNCFSKMGTYAFNVNGTNVNINYNEVYQTNYEPDPGGASGGGKWWGTLNANIDDNAFIQTGIGSAGGNNQPAIWFDNGNTGMQVSGNYFYQDAGIAVDNETGYNMEITNNIFLDDGWGSGSGGCGTNCDGAISLNHSGGFDIPGSRYENTINISGNQFTNDWQGIGIWQAGGRSCDNSGESGANGSDAVYCSGGFPVTDTTTAIASGGQYDFSHQQDATIDIDTQGRDESPTLATPASSGATNILVNSPEAIDDQIGFGNMLTTSTSNTTDVSTFSGSGVINANTSGFPSSGELRVGTSDATMVASGESGYTGAILSYTGTNGTQFTGVSLVRGSGTLDGHIQQVEPYKVTAETCYTNDCSLTITPGLSSSEPAGNDVSNNGTCQLFVTPTALPSGPTAPSGVSYFDGCQWEDRNISVTGNTFTFQPSVIASSAPPVGSGTTTTCDANNNNGCGTNFMAYQVGGGENPFNSQIGANALMSSNSFSGCPTWDSGCSSDPLNNINALSNHQGIPANNGEAPGNNVWSDNTYVGPWAWYAYIYGNCNGGGLYMPDDPATGKSLTAASCGLLNLQAWQADWQQDTGSVLDTNNPPTVSITSPTANTSVHGKTLSVASTATANDGGSITNAKLYVNNTLVQTLTSAPYNFTLDTTGYTDGSYTLKVQATDDQNNTTSQSVAVNITNGDFNGDGIVGLSDLIILAQNYGKTGTFSYSQGNITGATTSPEVGLPDLIILAQNYNYNDGLGH